VEVSRGNLTSYAGNYAFYKKEKVAREEIQQNAYENQQQMIKQTERFIERFRAKATKSNQVQSRVKALDRLDKISEVERDEVSVNFKFTFSQKSGRDVIVLDDVSKSFGDLQILDNTHARIERGDKIALIGANGKGKSTVLRIINGSETIEGKREEGYNVIKSFFAQHQLEALGVNNEILQEMTQAGSKKSETELQNVLGCFLFTNEDVFKKIKVLSGGEKSRVALAKTLISEANFLLLDEPTNHLDIQSVNILMQALQQYEGTFVTVSHDRLFIKGVANKIWYIEDEQIKVYPGTYDEYVYWRANQAEKEDKPVQAVKKDPKPLPKNAIAKQEDHAQKKALKEKEKTLESLEQQITALEKKKNDLEHQLAQPSVYENEAEMQRINEKYTKIKQDETQLNKEWEALAEQIESMQS
jgi:ATP-binding cassette subfamily F protein 3